MTTLVSVDTYRLHTRDVATNSSEVTARLADAQQLIERELDRPLAYTQGWTETLVPYRDEWRALCVMPRRVPIIAVTDGVIRAGEREIVQLSTFGVFVSATYWHDVDAGGAGEPLPLTVTFDGGWKPRGSADHELPVDLERAICFVASGLIRESALVGVAGTVNVKQAVAGDVQVQFAEPGEGLDRYAFGVSELLEQYRYRSML